MTAINAPVDDSFVDDFVSLYQLFGAATMRMGKQVWGPAFEAELASDFTKGLGAAFAGKWRRAPAFIRRLRRTRSKLARRTSDYDVVVMPTVAQVPPVLGHLGMAIEGDAILVPRFRHLQPVAELARANPRSRLAGGTGGRPQGEAGAGKSPLAECTFNQRRPRFGFRRAPVSR